jgi:hypothetical protein
MTASSLNSCAHTTWEQAAAQASNTMPHAQTATSHIILAVGCQVDRAKQPASTGDAG